MLRFGVTRSRVGARRQCDCLCFGGGLRGAVLGFDVPRKVVAPILPLLSRLGVHRHWLLTLQTFEAKLHALQQDCLAETYTAGPGATGKGAFFF